MSPARLIIALLLLALQLGAAESTRRQVLCLHSYHPADWSDAVQRGWREGLATRTDLDLTVEYMDTKRREDSAYLDLLTELYESKYQGVRFDLVLTSDDHAFRFAVKHRAALFSNAPVVFCGLNRWQEVVANRPANVSGIAEQANWQETLAMAVKVRPQARAVHVICDDTETAAKNLAELKSTLVGFPDLTLDHPAGLGLQGLRQHLARQPREDIALFIAYWRQPDGSAVSPDELADALRDSAAPIFGRSEWAIGRGQAGGMCVSGVRQGRAAAALGLAILGGTRADDLPLVTDSPNVAMFDWPELQHHGIDLALLPADAEILNRPDPLLRVPRPLVFMTLACLGLLVLLVVALIVLMRVRRRAQVATATAAANLRTILHSMGDGVIAVDAQGCVTALNPVAEQLTGWGAEVAAGRPIDDIFRLIDAAKQPLEIPAKTALRTGMAHHLSNHAVLIDRHGNERHIADSGAPMRDPAGRIVGAVLVFRDVSERYALEERLRRAQTMEAMGRMAGGIAHDFNNMLTAILGSAQLLQSRLVGEGRERELAEQIVTSAQRAAELTGKLLTLSRGQPGPSGTCDLHACIEAVSALLKHVLKRDITLELDCAARHACVTGSRLALENALLNLCLNARDAMPHGGVLRLSTSDLADPPPGAAAHPEGWLRLTVADNGTGMDEATRGRVFEPFFTTKPTGQGTGLGLTMVYAAINELGGQVHLESAPARGTTVVIELPRCPPAAKPATTTAVLQVGPVRPGCILVVDDEPAALAIAKAALEADGHEVLTASDGIAGSEAFAAARERIDLVILDMLMPRCDGRGCLTAIRAQRADVPAILISGYIGDPTAAQGFDAVLAKPYHLDQLRRAVAVQLARRKT